MSIYISNHNQLVKEIYIGKNGSNKSISEVYIGDENNEPRLVWSSTCKACGGIGHKHYGTCEYCGALLCPANDGDHVDGNCTKYCEVCGNNGHSAWWCEYCGEQMCYVTEANHGYGVCGYGEALDCGSCGAKCSVFITDHGDYEVQTCVACGAESMSYK